MNLRFLPNLISILRILLVAPVAWFILQHDYALALVIFIVAGVSDGVDGYLARRFSWVTPLGKMLDPIGDKLLMVTAYLLLGLQQLLPLWLVILVIMRDVIILGGTAIYRYVVGAYHIDPLWVSKLNTVLQILLVVLIMFGQAFWSLPLWIVDAMIIAVATTTIASGYAYVSVWGKQAWQHNRQGEKQ